MNIPVQEETSQLGLFEASTYIIFKTFLKMHKKNKK